MRLLHAFRPGHHLREVDELAVVFGLGLGPDRLHRLDALAHQLGARGERRAMVFHLLGVPADADAEQEAAARDLIDRGHQLRGLDRIALVDQADAGADLQCLRRHRRGGQRHERVHRVVVLLRQIAAARERRAARGGDVRVLRRPDRFEAAGFERLGELHGCHGVVGEEHRRAEIHVRAPFGKCLCGVGAYGIGRRTARWWVRLNSGD